MSSKSKNVQYLDISEKSESSHSSSIPMKVREIVETWKGKGWGFRFERKRIETTKLIEQEDDNARQ